MSSQRDLRAAGAIAPRTGGVVTPVFRAHLNFFVGDEIALAKPSYRRVENGTSPTAVLPQTTRVAAFGAFCTADAC